MITFRGSGNEKKKYAQVSVGAEGGFNPFSEGPMPAAGVGI